MFKEEDFDSTRYYTFRSPFQLSQKANQYFTNLDALVQDENAVIPHCILPDKMIEGFQRFTKAEKIRYITENLRYLDSIIKTKNMPEMPDALLKQNKTIQVDCQVQTFLCFYRKATKLKLETDSRTLLLNQTDNIKMIDLQNYIIHEGKKAFRKQIYLQPLIQSQKSWSDIKRYEFTLSQKSFNSIYNDLYACIMDIRNKELISLFSNSKDTFRSQIVQAGTPLAQKIINKRQYQQFTKQKKYLLNEKGISHLNFEHLIYEERNKSTQLVIKSKQSEPNLFKAEIFSREAIYDVKERYLEAIAENKNRLLIQTQLLEDYEESVSSCVALFQKYYIKERPHSTIYMRQILSVTDLLMSNSLRSIISIEDKKRFDEFVFIKSVDSPLVRNFFRFICVFANQLRTACKSQDSYHTEIIIIADFNISHDFTSEMVVEFLCEHYYSIFDIQKKNKLDLTKKQSFRTSNASIQKKMPEAINVDEQNDKVLDKGNENKNEELMVEFAEPESGSCFNRLKFGSEGKEEGSKNGKNNILFIKHKFELDPKLNYNINETIVSENFMKNEWIRSEDGGLICTNQKLLVEHKKIFKHILASIGSNILKGGNILNVSLPVTIFKKEGHLQMIADSFSLAPRLLQNVEDPLQRMKKAVLVSISVGTLGISVEKPFFPTLGQTLQVWIAGCPMYMEQILRYPPTGAYLFYGRGYRIHGQVQPKISFGINGGKGYSERPSYIQFSDGQTIELSYGKLVISGIFVGDRQFNFYDKAFAYDKKNNYFAEIIFGARDTQIFGKNKQKKDFLYGKIYQLTEQFSHKFENAQIPKPYPTKKYIKNVLSQFQGHWNSEVKFDNVSYVNFLKDWPNRVEPEEFCLPSDTRFRKDLINLKSGDIEEAQKQKELLEEGQRKDRKLRTQKKLYKK